MCALAVSEATVDRFTSAQITAAHLNGMWVLLET